MATGICETTLIYLIGLLFSRQLSSDLYMMCEENIRLYYRGLRLLNNKLYCWIETFRQNACFEGNFDEFQPVTLFQKQTLLKKWRKDAGYNENFAEKMSGIINFVDALIYFW